VHLRLVDTSQDAVKLPAATEHSTPTIQALSVSRTRTHSRTAVK